MIYYVLYNSQTKKYLEHPQVGLWSTQKRDEAEAMLQVASAYVRSLGNSAQITIKEVDEHFDPKVERLKQFILDNSI